MTTATEVINYIYSGKFRKQYEALCDKTYEEALHAVETADIITLLLNALKDNYLGVEIYRNYDFSWYCTVEQYNHIGDVLTKRLIDEGIDEEFKVDIKCPLIVISLRRNNNLLDLVFGDKEDKYRHILVKTGDILLEEKVSELFKS